MFAYSNGSPQDFTGQMVAKNVVTFVDEIGRISFRFYVVGLVCIL